MKRLKLQNRVIKKADDKSEFVNWKFAINCGYKN